MEKSTVLIFLTLLTLLSGLGWGFYQLWAVQDAKKKGSHHDGSKDNPNASASVREVIDTHLGTGSAASD